MYKNDRRYCNQLKGCSPLQLSRDLMGMKPSIGYYSHTTLTAIFFLHHPEIKTTLEEDKDLAKSFRNRWRRIYPVVILGLSYANVGPGLKDFPYPRPHKPHAH